MARGDLRQVYALHAGLVEPPSHGTARPGAKGVACPERSFCVNVPQSQVGKAGGLHLGPGYGAAGGGGVHRVCVEDHQLQGLFPWGPEPLQQAGAVHAGKSGAPDPAVQLRQADGGELRLRENMYVFRPRNLKVGRIRRQIIVVSGSHENRRLHGLQDLGQSPRLLPAALGPVQQVPGQQDQPTIQVLPQPT